MKNNSKTIPSLEGSEWRCDHVEEAHHGNRDHTAAVECRTSVLSKQRHDGQGVGEPDDDAGVQQRRALDADKKLQQPELGQLPCGRGAEKAHNRPGCQSHKLASKRFRSTRPMTPFWRITGKSPCKPQPKSGDCVCGSEQFCSEEGREV